MRPTTITSNKEPKFQMFQIPILFYFHLNQILKCVTMFQVHWYQQQTEKRRVKREYAKRDIFSGHPFIPSYDSDFSSSLFTHRHSANRNHYRSGGGLSSFSFPDPLYKEEWYLVCGLQFF